MAIVIPDRTEKIPELAQIIPVPILGNLGSQPPCLRQFSKVLSNRNALNTQKVPVIQRKAAETGSRLTARPAS